MLILYSEITYICYLINEKGFRPGLQNIESVMNYPLPRNVKELYRFVCLASYFRRFVPNFLLIAKPLYDLIKVHLAFNFEPKENEASELLKSRLSSQPIWAIYSPTLETELHCEARTNGFGTILLQNRANGMFQQVFYFSHRTTPAESKYHTFELECLAAVYAIKRFHVYLTGINIKIVTDCDSFSLTLRGYSSL